MPTLRILHLADIHLGMENYGRVDPATGLSTRLGDFLRTLNIALDWALENDVHLVVIAGDIFKNRDPTPTVQREFAKCIRKLSEAGMPTFIVVGNHDVPNAMQRANTVEIYSTLAIPQVTIAQKPGVHVIDTRAGRVQIAALPWVSRAYLMTNREISRLDPDSLNKELLTMVENFIDESADKLDPTLPALLVAHASVQGAVFSSERDIMLGQDIVLPRTVVANPRFDYVAMGHIHKHQVLSQTRPPIVYPGSLERIDFGEQNDKKGFVSVEIDEPGPDGVREVRHEFHEVPARRFLTIKVNADVDFPTEEVLRRIDEHEDEIKDAVVRLMIETTPERLRDLRQDEIRRALNAKGPSFSAVIPNTTRTHRIRLGDQVIEQMSPRQALEIYLQNKDTPPERMAVLLKHFDKLNASIAEADKSKVGD
ncbi:MAG TPA: exonuclease SbcCD subunit D [Chloroflexia bacterium]|nr:exonuclease SbcCD subunit D [Chloroflexia bacterium]